MSMNNTGDNAEVGCGLASMAIVLFLFIGYIMNIIEIFSTVDDPVTGLFIARCIGVLAVPFGGVIGWF